MADIHKQSQVQLVLDQLNAAPLVKEIVYDILTIERISNKQFNDFTTPIINQLLDIAAANSGIMSYRHFHNMLVTMSWIEAQVKVLLNLDETQLYMQRSAVIEKLDEVNLILDEIMIDSQYGVDGHIVKIDDDELVETSEPSSVPGTVVRLASSEL
ncbi:hypothetical protein DL93DRAFT_1964689 [Clavulina sp. PMI_390]|nr:hypothetical protein DL93DRAFT_1964689 [Clavulina sp. PMI_390]